MKRLFAFVLLASGCALAQTSPPVTSDDAVTINGDRRFAHSSSGQILYGPSFAQEWVVGQRDAAGNVHTDWLPSSPPQ